MGDALTDEDIDAICYAAADAVGSRMSVDTLTLESLAKELRTARQRLAANALTSEEVEALRFARAKVREGYFPWVRAENPDDIRELERPDREAALAALDRLITLFSPHP